MLLKVLILAALGAFASGQRTTCTFQVVGFSYTCRLENQVIRSDNDMEQIGGVHNEDLDNINVKSLYSNSSTITVFPSLIVDHFVNLAFVKLEKVQLKTFNRAITNCKELFQVDLNENEIEVIPAGIFQKCQSLTTLSLNRNHIKTINDDAFLGLTSLNSLWLWTNNIGSINRQIFRHTLGLRAIFLNQNEIEAVAADTFVDLQELYWLEINLNRLTKWNKDILSQNPKVEKLGLDGNQISTLDVDTFSNLPNLVELSIGSLLEEIPAFEGVQRLEKLIIGKNQIKKVSAASFAHMESLNYLYISNGLVEKLDFSMTTPRILTNLQTLYLTNNSISTLEGSSLEMLTGLQTLSLAQNQIRRLTYDTLKPVLPLESLYINYNEMTFIDRRIIEDSKNMRVYSFGNRCYSGDFHVNEALDLQTLEKCFNSGLNLKMNSVVLIVAVFVAIFMKFQ
jgi:platelet glycoprotein V